jgi:hypothetical protein
LSSFSRYSRGSKTPSDSGGFGGSTGIDIRYASGSKTSASTCGPLLTPWPASRRFVYFRFRVRLLLMPPRYRRSCESRPTSSHRHRAAGILVR